jgi:uncharacterized protein (TIGR02996 family)
MIDRYPAEMRPFIEAILANPHDDAPVLIFADWLEENGFPMWGNLCRLELCYSIEELTSFFCESKNTKELCLEFAMAFDLNVALPAPILLNSFDYVNANLLSLRFRTSVPHLHTIDIEIRFGRGLLQEIAFISGDTLRKLPPQVPAAGV